MKGDLYRQIRLTAIAFVLLVPGAASGKQIHVLMVGDTLDQGIGASVRRDLANFSAVFDLSVPQRQLTTARVSGQGLTKANIVNTIQGFRVGGDDTVVFFWSGHGAHDQQGRHYFKLLHEEVLYRDEVIRRLQAKGPRLTVVLTDTCDRFHERPLGVPLVAPRALPREVAAPLFDALFLAPRGLVDVNACAQGEAAWAAPEGGLLVLALCCPGGPCKVTDDGTRAAKGVEVGQVAGPGGAGPPVPPGYLLRRTNEYLSWRTVLADVRQDVHALYQRARPGNARQATQTVTSWSLPEYPKVSLQPGDVIFSVNGQTLLDADEFWDAVKRSPPTMAFTIRDRNTRRVLHLETALRVGRGSRFGVAGSDDYSDGIHVVGVDAGSPGSRAIVVKKEGKPVRLEPDDVILSINGEQINSQKAYWNAVKESPPIMTFKLRNHRNGNILHLKTRLRSGDGSRFGVDADNNNGDGVRVVQAYDGYPGTRCQTVP